MRDTQIQPLGQEKLPKKEMEIHSSILSWRTPWTEEPGWLQPMESQRVVHNWATNTFFSQHILVLQEFSPVEFHLFIGHPQLTQLSCSALERDLRKY